MKIRFLGVKLVALCIVLVWFSWNIWPTPFQIIIVEKDAYRINRITGVRQTSTAHGWMTEEEIRAEAQRQFAKDEQDRLDSEQKETQARNEQQRREAEAREEQTRRDEASREERMKRDGIARAEQEKQEGETNAAIIQQTRQALEGLHVDASQRDFNQVVLRNPTDWSLHSSSDQNTHVEYCRTNSSGKSKALICKDDTLHNINFAAKQSSAITVAITEINGNGLAYEVATLPRGTLYAQNVALTFDEVQIPLSNGTTRTAKAMPPITIKFRRLWKR